LQFAEVCAACVPAGPQSHGNLTKHRGGDELLLDSAQKKYNPTFGKQNAGGWIMAGSRGKIYQDRGRWFIQLPGRIRIFCDKQHRSFYSRQHAEWTLNQIQGEIENGTFDETFYAKKRKSLHSFSVYAEEWLTNCERRVKRSDLSPSYLKDLRRFVRKQFIPFFGDMSIMDIRGKHLKSFYLQLEQAPKTVFNIMAALHKLFKDAVDEEVIQSMPKFPMEFRASNLPDPDWKWASEEQQDAVLEHLEPNDLFFIYFMMTHGTRTGEARALQHQDIDLTNDRITIRRAFSGTELRPFTKTKRVRTIPLDPTWKELYLSQPRSINPNGLVFLRNGQPFSESWARKKWNEAREKAGLAPITLYAGTRHSIASQAANRGGSLYAIGKFLGHSNTRQTERYSHLETRALQQVQRKTRIVSDFSAKCLQRKKHSYK
jgi:integrase